MSRQSHDPNPILSDSSLPEFDAPPVAEVALSVAFEPLDTLRAPQIGLLWQEKFRHRFPVVEEQVPLEPMHERFGQPSNPEFSISFDPGTSLPRLWFLNSEGTELIQLQRNWFARNWRKIAASGVYPRYPHLLSTFLKDYGDLCAFAKEEKLGDPLPTQCEITYVNQISPNEEWTSVGELHKVLRLFGRSAGEFPGQPEQGRLAVSWIMNIDESPVGRLHCTVGPATSIEKNEPLIVLTLTARGAPRSPNSEGLTEFLDLGREYIVRTFDSITTDEMHRIWGKRQ